MSIKVFKNGVKIVASAATPEAIESASKSVSWTAIMSLPTNGTTIWIGDSDVTQANGMELQTTDSPLYLFDVDISDVYIRVPANGEGVKYIYGV